MKVMSEQSQERAEKSSYKAAATGGLVGLGVGAAVSSILQKNSQVYRSFPMQRKAYFLIAATTLVGTICGGEMMIQRGRQQAEGLPSTDVKPPPSKV
eukprot:m.40839 g.40839  ORF g.40839 m.40839 type:complete len:97 (-) comp14163_c0_seq1:273-563(-)